MSYQEDFVLRLARRIGEVLARALGVAKQGSYDESHQVLEQGVASELGMPFHMLLRLDAASAVRLLGRDKAAQLVEALRTRALLFELGGRHNDSQISRDHADTLERALS
ncbi:MAG TPA: hypothetical protein VEX18_17965 [Polyangiaceae bacterium]|nr:hypothetical protein [Polyangiaceae bacterium]